MPERNSVVIGLKSGRVLRLDPNEVVETEGRGGVRAADLVATDVLTLDTLKRLLDKTIAIAGEN